jgi:hypothetical protein
MNSENMASAAALPIPGLDTLNISAMFAATIFGLIGFTAFLRGRKKGQAKTLIIGISLMAYPFLVTNPVVTWLVGIALTAALFIFRDE